MLVQGDVKGLEWVAGTFLSQDKVAYEEILNKVDQHSDNQKNFNLPSRLIAKKFIFKLVYGSTAYSYVNNPDFSEVGFSEEKWQGVIDGFYSKYQGWRNWHIKLMQEASTTGGILSPTGRFYPFSPTRRGNDLVWPRTKILNYPVQGFGADLVSVARVIAFYRWKKFRIESKPITTVHDSIVFDTPSRNVKEIGKLLLSSVEAVPSKLPKLFGINFDLPLTAEIKVGRDLCNMEEIKL